MFKEREYYGNIWRNLVEIASNQLKEEREAAKLLGRSNYVVGLETTQLPSGNST